MNCKIGNKKEKATCGWTIAYNYLWENIIRKYRLQPLDPNIVSENIQWGYCPRV